MPLGEIFRIGSAFSPGLPFLRPSLLKADSDPNANRAEGNSNSREYEQRAAVKGEDKDE